MWWIGKAFEDKLSLNLPNNGFKAQQIKHRFVFTEIVILFSAARYVYSSDDGRAPIASAGMMPKKGMAMEIAIHGFSLRSSSLRAATEKYSQRAKTIKGTRTNQSMNGLPMGTKKIESWSSGVDKTP